MRGFSSLKSQQIENLSAVQETQEMQVQSMGREDPLEKEMATHSSILAQENPLFYFTRFIIDIKLCSFSSFIFFGKKIISCFRHGLLW